MLKKFIGYYKNHKFLFGLDMSCALIIAVIDLSIPLMVKIFIDSAIPTKNISQMITISVILIVILISTIGLNFIVSYYGHVMGTKIERDMRQDLFEHFQKMDSKFFTGTQVGNLMSRLVGDLRDVSEFSHHGPEDLFLSLIMLTGSFIILSRINVILTLALLFIAILMVIFTSSRRKRMSKAFIDTRVVHADLNGRIENILSGISVMKSYTNEKFELKRFKKSNQSYQDSWSGAYFEMGVFSSAMEFSLKLMTVVVIILGGYFALNGKISTGELAAFILYISYFTSPLKRLIGFLINIKKDGVVLQDFIICYK